MFYAVPADSAGALKVETAEWADAVCYVKSETLEGLKEAMEREDAYIEGFMGKRQPHHLLPIGWENPMGTL